MSYTRTNWENGTTPLNATNMNNIEDGIAELNTRINGLIDIFYPVGSYYETSDASFNPNNEWGGSWVLEDAGKVHVGAGTGYTLGSTGGNKDAIVPSHTHTLTRTTNVGVAAHGITQPTFSYPNHTHGIYLRDSAGRDYSGSSSNFATANNYSRINTTAVQSSGGGACTRTTNVALTNNHSVTQPEFTCESTGSSVTDANMQPYIVVNRWHRTA